MTNSEMGTRNSELRLGWVLDWASYTLVALLYSVLWMAITFTVIALAFRPFVPPTRFVYLFLLIRTVSSIASRKLIRSSQKKYREGLIVTTFEVIAFILCDMLISVGSGEGVSPIWPILMSEYFFAWAIPCAILGMVSMYVMKRTDMLSRTLGGRHA